MSNTKRLTNKRAFITAAGQGIGRATVEAYLREGAEVIACDINQDSLDELSEMQGVTAINLDVTNGEAVRRIVKEVGEIDILFNCAGFVHSGTILDCDEDDWDFSFTLNCKAMYRLSRLFIPGMQARGKGSIINMASVLSSVTSAPNRFVYTASKAAVIGITKAIAADFVTENIRCNAICPGTVDSPSLHQRLRDTGDYDAALAAFIARQPMGRIGKAEEMAALAVYLGSDESAFTTGQAHVIDGGWAI